MERIYFRGRGPWLLCANAILISMPRAFLSFSRELIVYSALFISLNGPFSRLMIEKTENKLSVHIKVFLLYESNLSRVSVTAAAAELRMIHFRMISHNCSSKKRKPDRRAPTTSLERDILESRLIPRTKKERASAISAERPLIPISTDPHTHARPVPVEKSTAHAAAAAAAANKHNSSLSRGPRLIISARARASGE